jgi:hypothetical protein
MPKYHGKGTDFKLLRHCFDIADKKVVDTWLPVMPEATICIWETVSRMWKSGMWR